MIAEFKRIRPLFYGDYYPLTAHDTSDKVWMAYQFHREDLKQGMVMAFRRQENADESMCLKLHGLDPSEKYEVTFEDSGVKKTLTGEALQEGIDVTISDKPGSVLITYCQCE